MKEIIIDIREEGELLDNIVVSSEKIIINIPMRNIQFNIDAINKLSENYTIYLLCRSSNRSDKIKKLFFEENPKIISIKGGLKNLPENVELIQGKNGKSFQQIMQLM